MVPFRATNKEQVLPIPESRKQVISCLSSVPLHLPKPEILQSTNGDMCYEACLEPNTPIMSMCGSLCVEATEKHIHVAAQVGLTVYRVQHVSACSHVAMCLHGTTIKEVAVATD